MTEFVQISRDSYAREDVVRRRVVFHPLNPNSTCDYCGNQGKKLASGDIRLFQYGIWTDSGRFHWQSETFDNISCMRNYHGI